MRLELWRHDIVVVIELLEAFHDLLSEWLVSEVWVLLMLVFTARVSMQIDAFWLVSTHVALFLKGLLFSQLVRNLAVSTSLVLTVISITSHIWPLLPRYIISREHCLVNAASFWGSTTLIVIIHFELEADRAVLLLLLGWWALQLPGLELLALKSDGTSGSSRFACWVWRLLDYWSISGANPFCRVTAWTLL